jgi:hypothetical protein
MHQISVHTPLLPYFVELAKADITHYFPKRNVRCTAVWLQYVRPEGAPRAKYFRLVPEENGTEYMSAYGETFEYKPGETLLRNHANELGVERRELFAILAKEIALLKGKDP